MIREAGFTIQDAARKLRGSRHDGLLQAHAQRTAAR